MVDLKFDRVSKRYHIRREASAGTARNPLLLKLQSMRRRTEEFWAVRDVNFEVRRGEALGIIGHNGAGKSTILKLLANITAPTSGEITINGHLSALIEVGSGFHPELTGRENIYLNGSILGMRRGEITKKLDSIVDFAGISQFIDTPVKRFSSGMYVRLGFSIAAHLEPDILLLDEVLAVGDAAFQSKCIQRIGELKRAGTTIVFISHDLGAVERLCDRVLLMQRGQVMTTGSPREVINQYQRTDAPKAPATHRSQSTDWLKAAEVTTLSFQHAGEEEAASFHTGDPLIARLKYEASARVADAVFEVVFYTLDGNVQCQLSTELSSECLALEPGSGEVRFFCDELGLAPGLYYTDVSIKERGALEMIDCVYRSTILRVDPGKTVHGAFHMPHRWWIIQADGANDGLRDQSSVSEFV